MQKGQGVILVLIGILVIMVVAGGTFYLGRSTRPKTQPINPVVTSSPQPTHIPSPTPDPTVNWKTVKSEFGYSFKYPNNFWITSGETRRIKDGGFSYEHGDAPPAPAGTVGFLEIVSSMTDSADILANQKLDDFPKSRVVVDKTILVSGYKTRYVEIEFIDNSKVFDILVFIQKDNDYAIYLSVNNSASTSATITNEELKVIFNQILSTFKFL